MRTMFDWFSIFIISRMGNIKHTVRQAAALHRLRDSSRRSHKVFHNILLLRGLCDLVLRRAWMQGSA